MAGPTERFAPRALVLDMDGLMVDSEPLWFQVEREFAAARGGVWTHARGARAAPAVGTLTRSASWGRASASPSTSRRTTAEMTDRFLARIAELALKPGCRELLGAAAGRAPARRGLVVAAAAHPGRARTLRPGATLRGRRLGAGGRASPSPRPTSSCGPPPRWGSRPRAAPSSRTHWPGRPLVARPGCSWSRCRRAPGKGADSRRWRTGSSRISSQRAGRCDRSWARREGMARRERGGARIVISAPS